MTWNEAKAAYEAALNAETEYERAIWTPAYEAAEASGGNIPQDISDEIERLADARCDAEDLMILTAASDLHSVIFKIDRSRVRWEGFCDWPDDWWDAIMNDLHRFAGEARHVTQ